MATLGLARKERFCGSARACRQWCCSYNPLRRLLVYLVLVLVYVITGACIFSLVEGPEENKRRVLAEGSLVDLKLKLLTLVNHNETTLDTLLLNIEQICSSNALQQGPKLWEFAPSVLFTTTVVTTIGYGNIAPTTRLGQILVIPYALLGIPLNVLFLMSVGHWLSMIYKKVYSSIGNHWCLYLLSYLLLLVAGWCIFAVLPAAVFSSIERNWSYTEALYFSVVTLTTVGFGDYVPARQMSYSGTARIAYDICFSIWLFVGMAYIALLLSQIGEVVKTTEDNVVKQLPCCKRFEKTFGKYIPVDTEDREDDLETGPEDVENNLTEF